MNEWTTKPLNLDRYPKILEAISAAEPFDTKWAKYTLLLYYDKRDVFPELRDKMKRRLRAGRNYIRKTKAVWIY